MFGFSKFIEFSGAFVENPVVLTCDNAPIHTSNVPVIDDSNEHGVIIITLSPHTTNRMQQLAAACMRPLLIAYGNVVKEWTDDHIGEVVTHCELPQLLDQDFEVAAVSSSAKNELKKTGIWPFNKDYFTDKDLAPGELVNNLNQIPPQPVQVPVMPQHYR
ncbi:uncharacterized protein LOC107043380 [Diachasma alloeum]|uniref:uncharacterized protein LOC107043380 n=1 Tax=Diachasma alloeum TaxID=454923 RepID=UPI0007384C0C|nr:uncharacterized protein LOC107043380 [Diachasma alloeum]